MASNDTSPGIYVPFELSQTSCYSQGSVDVEEKTYLEADGELETKDPPSEEQLPVCQSKPNSEEDSDVELVQDAGAESITSNASNKIGYDESEWDQHANHTIEGKDVQHSGDEGDSMPESRFERKQHQKDGSGTHGAIVEKMKLNKIDEVLNCTVITLTKKKISQKQSRCEISQAEPSGLIRSTDKRKRKLHKAAGNQEGSSEKTDDKHASSILRKSRHGNVRRKKRRSFEMVRKGFQYIF